MILKFKLDKMNRTRFTCSPSCKSQGFDDEKKFKQHRRRKHKESFGKTNVDCSFAPACKERFSRIVDMRAHLIEKHPDFNVVIEEIDVNFATEQHFMKWKEENIETEKSFERYVKHSGKKSIFYCHRSGFVREKERKTQKSKSQGSNKINCHCISQIKLVKQEDGTFRAIWTKTHTNHESEIQHCEIDRKTRSVIYGLLLLGLSPKAIVEKMQSKVKTERLYHLLLRDVLNIRRDTGVGDVSRGEMNADDATSVHIFVENNRENVLMYKPNNIPMPDVYPELDANDFAIAFMVPFQVEQLDQLSNEFSVICIDATHGVGHGYKMITVLTVDEFYQGMPLAFCISKSEKSEVLRYFFEAIKVRAGKSLISKFFVSDDAEYYFNTWKTVMDPENNHLIDKWICSWHVNKTLKRQAKAKIRNVPKQTATVELLMSLKSELDKEKHDEKVKLFHEHCQKDPELKDFYDYLVVYYFNRMHEWAYVYKNQNCLNTNMHLESFHSTFKVCYLDRRAHLRVDFTINRLLQYLEDREHKFNRNKIFGVNSKTNSHTFSFHKEAVDKFYDFEIVPDESNSNMFFVKRKGESHVFAIERIKENDESHCCLLTCKQCKICIHDFKCSCLQYRASHKLCKHVHLVNIHVMKYMQNIDLEEESHERTNLELLHGVDLDIHQYSDQNNYDYISYNDDCPDVPQEDLSSSQLPTECVGFTSQLYQEQEDDGSADWEKIEQHLTQLSSKIANLKAKGTSAENVQSLNAMLFKVNANVDNMMQSGTGFSNYSPKKRSRKRLAEKQIRFDNVCNPRKKQKRSSALPRKKKAKSIQSIKCYQKYQKKFTKKLD